MAKLGPREAQIRALREAQFREQPQRQRSQAPVTNVTNRPSITALNDKARVTRWRAKNPDRYRTYMRDLMRRLRAERRKAA